MKYSLPIASLPVLPKAQECDARNDQKRDIVWNIKENIIVENK